MLVKWGEGTTVRFIEIYREQEYLWDLSSTQYRNKQAR
jgi:hypothetical protein